MNTGPGEGLEEPDPGAGREFPTQEGPGPGSESVRGLASTSSVSPTGARTTPQKHQEKGGKPPQKKEASSMKKIFACSGRVLLSLLGASKVEVCRVSLLFGPSLTAPARDRKSVV